MDVVIIVQTRISLLKQIWSWPVVGGVILAGLGTGVAFTTSVHPTPADYFYSLSAALFAGKFLTWEDARQQVSSKRRIAYCAATGLTLIVLSAVIWGNHRLNAPQRVTSGVSEQPLVEHPPEKTVEGAPKTEAKRAQTPATKTAAAKPEQVKSLRVRFSQKPPYRWDDGGQTRFRFGIYNPPGRPVAENVQVTLTDIEPKPRDAQFTGDFPYTIYSANSSQVMPVLINPDAEHLFEIGMVWKGGEGGRQLIVGGLGRQPGSYNSGIFMDRNEVWHLHMRVTAANAKAFEIVFEMRAEDGLIHLKRL
jgi:hypothetical protein